MTPDPTNAAPEDRAHPGSPVEPTPSQDGAQPVFVGALLLVVLTVIAAYLLGDFKGHNAGADFGIIIGATLIIALFVGFITAAVRNHITRRHR